ncbi:DENN domain-containing protein 1A isoform X3 [Lycorma delicatula]|uniref:DENN domain-containing protein 1A isoform X3 n=1 Tax=Lycorma delicatula TaxID=130591 RepID=UPI003F5126A9
MGSRIRESVKHLFECFCEVVGPQPQASNGTADAWIIQKFPETYKDEDVLKSVPKFAYPCEFDNSVVQHYSFVLTSADSKWTFGFCRHDPKSATALVVLSFLPWHESFYKFLNHISELTHGPNMDELWQFLDKVYQSKVPDPGTTMQITFNKNQSIFTCQGPKQFQLPSIPENRNLTEYYNAVDGPNMMIIFASMLYERRIVFTSKKLYRLSACVQSANAIIYPMNWQHIFIPVLPQQLVDYLLAPMPYLIGVPQHLLQKVRRNDMGEVVILDADSNTIETPFNDLETLPQDVVRNLRAQLKNRPALLGDGVSRAFLRALVQLIGGYRDALKFHQGERITFNRDAFVESRPASMQPFLRKMLELQIFQQFIEERLDMLNSGLGFSDEFEMEACNYSDKTSSRLKQQYKEWTHNMRKEGTAFFKTVKNKANPAMRSAVKTVKERGKDMGKAYKGIRSKLRDFQPPPPLTQLKTEEDYNKSGKQPRPHTAFYTATTSYRRDLNVSSSKYRNSAAPDLNNTVGGSTTTQYNYSPLTTPSPSSSSSPTGGDSSNLQLSPLDMDLMGDLQDVIFRNCSASSNDASLKPVRSLENFPLSRSYTDQIKLVNSNGNSSHNQMTSSSIDFFESLDDTNGGGNNSGNNSDSVFLLSKSQQQWSHKNSSSTAQMSSSTSSSPADKRRDVLAPTPRPPAIRLTSPSSSSQNKVDRVFFRLKLKGKKK